MSGYFALLVATESLVLGYDSKQVSQLGCIRYWLLAMYLLDLLSCFFKSFIGNGKEFFVLQSFIDVFIFFLLMLYGPTKWRWSYYKITLINCSLITAIGTEHIFLSISFWSIKILKCKSLIVFAGFSIIKNVAF